MFFSVSAACHQSCNGCTGPSASDCITCRAGYAVDVNTNECSGNIFISEVTVCLSFLNKVLGW